MAHKKKKSMPDGDFIKVGGWGVQVGRFGVVGWGAQAPLTSPCPRSNHIKTEYWDRAGGGGNIRYEW